MKSYYKILAVLYLVTISQMANAQELADSVKSIIVKNIISYHFRYALNYDIGLEKDDLLSGNKLFFVKYWPDSSNQLRVECKKLDIPYPKADYDVYSLVKKRYQYDHDKTSIHRRDRLRKMDTNGSLVECTLVGHSENVAEAQVTFKELKFIQKNAFSRNRRII